MNTLFWIAALTGTLFFSLKVLASFIFGFIDDVGELDFDADGLQPHGTDQAFQLFSIHSLTGFLMMFGWVGLACNQQYGLPGSLSIAVALLAGFLMMMVTAYLFKWAFLLVSPGAKFRIQELVDMRAVVYQKIPAAGSGKIQVALNGYQREIRAVSANHQEIDSFTEVTVEKVVDTDTVSVKAVIPKYIQNPKF